MLPSLASLLLLLRRQEGTQKARTLEAQAPPYSYSPKRVQHARWLDGSACVCHWSVALQGGSSDPALGLAHAYMSDQTRPFLFTLPIRLVRRRFAFGGREMGVEAKVSAAGVVG